MNEKLYIIGGYDWHLAEYSDAVFLLQKKEKNVSSKNLNSIIPLSLTNMNSNNINNSVNMKNNTNSNTNNSSASTSNNNSNNKSNKSVLKTEFKWILQESRLLQGRSSHACVSFEGKIWIAGMIKLLFIYLFNYLFIYLMFCFNSVGIYCTHICIFLFHIHLFFTKYISFQV